MITKEDLQQAFPKFRIHSAKFKEYDFFLLSNIGYTFHIDVFREEDTCNAKLYKYSEKIEEYNCIKEKLIDYLNIIIRTYDINRI